MDNYDISDALGFYAKLSELHNENPFKVKAFAAAAFNIKKVKEPIEALSKEKLDALPGVGKSVISAILTIIETGAFPDLQNLISKTPDGIMEMLRIKGLGPKKVQSIWKNMQIETVEDLFDACRENRLVEQSGFGLKTQNEVIRAIEFSWGAKGKFHYARIEKPALELIAKLTSNFSNQKFEFTGQFRRKCEIIDVVEIVTTLSQIELQAFMLNEGYELNNNEFKAVTGHKFQFIYSESEEFDAILFQTTAAQKHLEMLGNVVFDSNEENTYKNAGLPYIIPEMREGIDEIERAKRGWNGTILEFGDLKGSLHNHSTYSDGLHSLAEMAEYCKSLGYEYLGICDHSKSAGYANGLSVEKVLEQHAEIDKLNRELAPFYIFKGIESDILGDGRLDYEPEILFKFELVVASIHSNLKMQEDAATNRLKKAIENPFTHILGHPTGRLLLIRSGYPINHQFVIDACAANGVAIELNANPYRLDLDWRWIGYAMDKGVKISINPDAHEKHAYNDMYFGTMAARKGGLTKEMTLNALNAEELKKWLQAKRQSTVHQH